MNRQQHFTEMTGFGLAEFTTSVSRETIDKFIK
jgi:hypothetical protein